MLHNYIRSVPNFPKKGINFKDISPLLADAYAMSKTFEKLVDHYRNEDFDLIAGAESRGFIVGVGIAVMLNKGFVPIRKPGKLPCDTYHETFELEYGADTLEIHKDNIKPGQKVLLVDDLLATGGTMEASIRLVNKCDAIIIGCAVIIELENLEGRNRLSPYSVFSLIKYNEE